MNKKLINLSQLEKRTNFLKKKGKKIVLCHGVFDLLHVGHIKHFKKSKSLGHILVVTLTADKFVNKGPNKPTFDENLRAESLASLEVVDYVCINNFKTSINILKKIRPDFYCKGADYKIIKNDITGEIKNEIKTVKKFKGKVIFTDEITFSSSNIINKYSQILSHNQKNVIEKIKKKYNFLNIKKSIDDFKKLKVLVIGETIIDQYVFCEALGKSGKEPVLVLRDLKTEEYLGGAAALAENISNFTNKVSLLTMLGEKKEYSNFIKKKLSKNINFQFICKKGSPTILKRRFLDDINKNKVLGVYNLNDQILDYSQEKKLLNKIKNIISKFDLVIVSDYGHGFITKKVADLICKKSKFLALNAQVNAANIGYHSMRNYKNIDCVIINATELRHEMRNKDLKIETLMKSLSIKLNINYLVVTRGSLGSILYNKKINKYFYSDAYAKTVIDKIGAGDTMLSLVSLSLKYGLNFNVSLLLSSLGAAQSVETIGNKYFLNKNKILRHLENILK